MLEFVKGFAAAAGITRSLNSAAALLAAVSMLQLVRYGWNFGLSAPLYAILKTYDETVAAVFELITPLLTPVFNFLSSVLSVPVDPGDHWRHIFVLLSILLM